MKRRPNRFLDIYIIESFVEKGSSQKWGEIKNYLKKQKILFADKVLWEALQRLEEDKKIKKNNETYYLNLKIPETLVNEIYDSFNKHEIGIKRNLLLKYIVKIIMDTKR